MIVIILNQQRLKMRVKEALEILSDLDENMEVTLIFGNAIKNPYKDPCPQYNRPFFTKPAWVEKVDLPPYTITCTIH